MFTRLGSHGHREYLTETATSSPSILCFPWRTSRVGSRLKRRVTRLEHNTVHKRDWWPAQFARDGPRNRESGRGRRLSPPG
ncbi:hypothetical protein RRG08_060711 [Elysia crispata]|uniref:Uncharacterized protein n=1 Tax=Elysia crispata TaxID=231223 RepID=A0AAE0YJY5_9GAST|nr:hypothetical protein RRG08_029520 [Elysia crispata]KAK3748490.1 hypothetical protein RRG08_060711 [Elysia crispata]